VGWAVFDAADAAVLCAVSAAVGLNEPAWIVEAIGATDKLGRSNRVAQADALAIETARALIEGRWSDARARYLAAKRELEPTHQWFWLAMLNLWIGTRGVGHIPEAEAAMASAEEFFAGVGASSFVDRYRAAMVASEPEGRRAAPSSARTEVAAS